MLGTIPSLLILPMHNETETITECHQIVGVQALYCSSCFRERSCATSLVTTQPLILHLCSGCHPFDSDAAYQMTSSEWYSYEQRHSFDQFSLEEEEDRVHGVSMRSGSMKNELRVKRRIVKGDMCFLQSIWKDLPDGTSTICVYPSLAYPSYVPSKSPCRHTSHRRLSLSRHRSRRTRK